MKRFLLCALLALVTATQAHAMGGVITDFRGMVFGKPLDDMKLFKQVSKQGDLSFYSRYAEDRNFQGVALKDLAYGFYKNSLVVVLFSAQGPSSFHALKDYFDANYGPASQPKPNLKQFSYTAGMVSVQMSYDDTRKVVEVTYAFDPIMREMMSKSGARPGGPGGPGAPGGPPGPGSRY